MVGLVWRSIRAVWGCEDRSMRILGKVGLQGSFGEVYAPLGVLKIEGELGKAGF